MNVLHIRTSKVSLLDLNEDNGRNILSEQFDWSIDDFEPTHSLLRELIFKESL